MLASVYNDTMHTALGRYTPSELYLGRRINLPLHEPLKDEDRPRFTTTNYAELLQLALDTAQNVVMKRTMEKLEKNLAKSFGKEELKYKVNDSVGLSVESIPSEFKSAKLYPRWRGPYFITKISEDGKAIYLKDNFDVETKRAVSILRIKPWLNRNDVEKDLGEHAFTRKRMLENVQLDEIQNEPEERIISVGREDRVLRSHEKVEINGKSHENIKSRKDEDSIPQVSKKVRFDEKVKTKSRLENLKITNEKKKKSNKKTTLNEDDESMFLLTARTVKSGAMDAWKPSGCIMKWNMDALTDYGEREL
jgi:hypothetical protein